MRPIHYQHTRHALHALPFHATDVGHDRTDVDRGSRQVEAATGKIEIRSVRNGDVAGATDPFLAPYRKPRRAERPDAPVGVAESSLTLAFEGSRSA